MGLFKKAKGKNENLREEIPPRLPELPRLPDFPEIDEVSNEPIHQLPSFPNDSFGNKFSRDTIKEAVTGRKGEEETMADEFAEDWQTMRKPLIKENMERDFSPRFEKSFSKKDEEGPIFVRIDKFEESSKTIEEVKKKISEIEKMFSSVKKIKEDEEKEIGLWEAEIVKVKEKIDKIDKNIFSKLD